MSAGKTKAELVEEIERLRSRIGELEARFADEDDRSRSECGRDVCRAVLANIPDHIMCLDPDGRIRFINHTVEGLSRDEVIGRPMAAFLAQEGREVANACLDRVRRTHQPDRFEVTYESKAGDRRCFESYVGPIIEEGSLAGFAVRSTDAGPFREIEEELRESRHRAEQIALTIDDVFWMADRAEHRVLFASPAYEKLWGRSLASLYADPIDWILGIHPDDRERVEEAFGRIVDNNGYEEEFRVVRPDGSVRWVRDRGYPIAGEDGRAARVAGIAEDITDRREAEEALRASEAFNRSIIQSSSDCIKVLDTEGRLQFMSDSGLRLLGIEDITPYLNQPYESFWQPEDRAIAREAIAEALAGRSGHFQAMLPIEGAEPRWCDVLITPVLGSDGKPERLLGISRDVTHRRLAEARLQRLSRAVEQSPAGVVITDARGTIEYVNPEFTRMTGYAPDEAIGMDPSLLKSGQHPREHYDSLWTTIEAGHVWRGEFANRKKSGEVYWESSSISPIRNQEGEITHFVAVKEDITEQKRAAEELEEAYRRVRESLEQVRRMEELRDSFVHMIVHDMRSPLTGILWDLKLLTRERGRPAGPEEARKWLSRAKTSTSELCEMVSSLLDVSRLEEGKMPLQLAEHEVGSIVDRGIEMLGGAADERRIHVETACDPVKVRCDTELVQRVVTNLVGNALKFSPDDARVGVEVRCCTEGVRIAVTDNGPGVPAEQHSRIFDKFGQVEGPGGTGEKRSSGLGLTFCKLAVEAHGGTIGVESEQGRGSTFWFTLPRESPPQ
ncbi:PAS domain S-box protein [Verrucomicrobiota bacterium]